LFKLNYNFTIEYELLKLRLIIKENMEENGKIGVWANVKVRFLTPWRAG
jgi:hypothetical protein